MIEAMLQAERLLTVGMLDEAERLYQRAAAADPLNAMAVVGLSRVASERGDDAAAYQHARRALEIDPQNALAVRLEARLSEILAARGQPVERPASVGAPAPVRAADPGPPPAESPAATSGSASPDLGAAAQRAALARNPSMADHRQHMERRPRTLPPPRTEATESRAAEPPARRPGLLRRLLRRR